MDPGDGRQWHARRETQRVAHGPSVPRGQPPQQRLAPLLQLQRARVLLQFPKKSSLWRLRKIFHTFRKLIEFDQVVRTVVSAAAMAMSTRSTSGMPVGGAGTVMTPCQPWPRRSKRNTPGHGDAGTPGASALEAAAAVPTPCLAGPADDVLALQQQHHSTASTAQVPRARALLTLTMLQPTEFMSHYTPGQRNQWYREAIGSCLPDDPLTGERCSQKDCRALRPVAVDAAGPNLSIGGLRPGPNWFKCGQRGAVRDSKHIVDTVTRGEGEGGVDNKNRSRRGCGNELGFA